MKKILLIVAAILTLAVVTYVQAGACHCYKNGEYTNCFCY
jgi:hypothetical protein